MSSGCGDGRGKTSGGALVTNRIRYLKPDFFLDEDVAHLPPLVRLFFQGL